MPKQITIRGVPDEVHKELKERAEIRGQSMQEYLRRELERIASRPSADIWLERLRGSKQDEKRIEPFTSEEILHVTRMDAIHNPVLAEYWGDDADDDLIINP